MGMQRDALEAQKKEIAATIKTCLAQQQDEDDEEQQVSADAAGSGHGHTDADADAGTHGLTHLLTHSPHSHSAILLVFVALSL